MTDYKYNPFHHLCVSVSLWLFPVLKNPLNFFDVAGNILTDLLPGVRYLRHLSLVNDVSLEVAAPRTYQRLDRARRRNPRRADVDTCGASVTDAVQRAVDGRRLTLRAQTSSHTFRRS